MPIIENNNSNIKPGTVMAFPVNEIPVGWLICNGAAYSRKVYNKLFSVIGTTYGSGDGSTTFNIPDFRGRFLRGYGTDPVNPNRYSSSIGEYQEDGFKDHTHSYIATRTTSGLDSGGGTCADDVFLSYTTGGASPGAIPNETRPVNMAVVFCIKY